MDRFLTLTIFTKVVETGSFTAAARALELSPASVTEHVQALEKRLDTRLLNRTTRRIALTDEGAAYHEHCRQILDRLHEADTMLAAQRSSPRGSLRVSVPPLLGTRILIPAMPRFLARHPDLRVEMALSAQVPDFLASNLDLALVIMTEPAPGLVFRPLGLCLVRTLASPAYLARRGTPRTPEDLDRHDTIGVRDSPGVMLSTMRFQRNGRMFSRDVRSRFIADSGEAQRAAALADGGICQSYHYAAADLIEAGRLVPVLEDWEWSGPPLGAMHLPNRFLPPKVGAFLELAQEQLAGKVSPYRVDWDNR